MRFNIFLSKECCLVAVEFQIERKTAPGIAFGTTHIKFTYIHTNHKVDNNTPSYRKLLYYYFIVHDIEKRDA